MNLAPSLISSVIFGAKTLNFMNTLGMEVIGKTISVTTGSIGGLVSQFMKIDQPDIADFKKTLEEIDLDFKISVLEELVKEQTGQAPISVKKALFGVNDVLVKIDAELKTIKEAFDYHQTKYLNSWRRFDCSCNIETIRKHSRLLDDRYKVFTDLLKIYGASPNEEENDKKSNTSIVSLEPNEDLS